MCGKERLLLKVSPYPRLPLIKCYNKCLNSDGRNIGRATSRMKATIMKWFILSLNETFYFTCFLRWSILTLHVASYRTHHSQVTKGIVNDHLTVTHSPPIFSLMRVLCVRVSFKTLGQCNENTKHWDITRCFRHNHVVFLKDWIEIHPLFDCTPRCLVFMHRRTRVKGWAPLGLARRHASKFSIGLSHGQDYFTIKVRSLHAKYNKEVFLEHS